MTLGVGSAPYRNEYPEYFMRGKGGRLVQPLTDVSTRNISWGVRAAGA